MAGWEAGREGAAAQPVGEALALDQLHDQDGNAAVGVLEAVKRSDAGMVEGGDRLHGDREALRSAAQESRRIGVPRARAKGVFTDEGVFPLIS
jgi:hypothetical protein